MSLNLIKSISTIDDSDDSHLIRILLILNEASKRKRTFGHVDGITKLAKLDFLLRYPNCLERALKAKKFNTSKANIKKYERTTIESKMIRFRYGPWDHRYRKWIAILFSKNLTTTFVKGRTVYIGITEDGKEILSNNLLSSSYSDLKKRADLLYAKFGAYSSTKLMDFIYETFPELEKMKWGEKITL